jgi:hypothetical protein
MGKRQRFFFRNVSFECIEGKSGICLLLEIIFIGVDWLVNLTIIYIEKTIATALDINNTIKSFYGGCQLNESKSLNK